MFVSVFFMHARTMYTTYACFETDVPLTVRVCGQCAF